jgi:hypothetical protein
MEGVRVDLPMECERLGRHVVSWWLSHGEVRADEKMVLQLKMRLCRQKRADARECWRFDDLLARSELHVTPRSHFVDNPDADAARFHTDVRS